MEVKHLNVKIGADKEEYESAMKGVSASLQKHKEQFKKVGKAMTMAGGAIIGTLGMMVKKASDAQEITAKFGTVFQDVFEDAEKSAKNLADSYGLSSVAAKEMLSSTGDLLSGLGVAGDVALSLSERTQQLAVDLASFTNFSGGAKGASEALTKAMLGERESVKALGIVITEEMVKEQLLREGKEKLTGQALLQAKAEATLTIAMSQSKNAIGDYARTQDSLANVVRTLKADFEDLVVEIGKHLIPIVTSLAKKAKEIVGKVTEWMKAHPGLTKVIVIATAAIGALMLILGPLLIILPSLAAGIGIVAGAFMGIIAPIGLVVAAVGVATVTFLKLKSAQDEARKAGERYEENVKKLKDKLNETRKAVGMNNTEWSKLIKTYKGNYAAMAMAIHKGKEGKEMQEALAEVSKKSKKAFDEQKEATEELTVATEGLTKEAGTLIEKLEYVAPASMQLAQEFAAGKISILEYTTGMRNLRLEAERIADPYANLELALDSSVEGFEDWQESTEGVMGSVLESVGLWNQDSQAAYDENAAAAEESARAAQAAWEESHRHLLNFISNVGGVIGQLVQDFKFSWEGIKDFFGGLWDGILGSFKTMIGNMATEWAVGFLKNTLLNLTTGAVSEAAGTITTGIGSAIKSVTTTATKLATSFSPAGIIGSALTGAISGLISGLISGGKATTQIRILRDIRWWLETIQHHIEVGTNQALYAIKDQSLGGFYPKFDAMLDEFYKIRDATKGTLAALTSQGTVYVDVFRSAAFESVGVGITDSIGQMSGNIGGAISDMGDNIGGAVSGVERRIGELDFDTGGIIDAVDRMRDKFGGEANGAVPSFQTGGFVPRDTIAKLHAGEEVIPAGEGRPTYVFAPQYSGIYDRAKIRDLTEREIFPGFKRMLRQNKRGERVQFNRAQRKY